MKVVQSFLENNKVDNYKELVDNMLNNFKNIGANINVKIHLELAVLKNFFQKFDDLGEKQGHRSHQDVKTMEERYQG